MTLNPAKDPTCVLAFDFEEGAGNTAYDLSQYGNNGTIYGATRTRGKIGWALSFDGVDDYVRIPASASLDITDEITLEACVKRDAENVEWEMIINKDPAGPPDVNWFLGIYNNTAVVRVNTDTVHDLNSGTFISAGSWFHIVGTYDGNYLRIFVNGKEKNSISVTGKINADTRDVHIGTATGGTDYPFNGIIDQVRIYSRALSEKEILEHYYYGIMQLSQKIPSRYIPSPLKV